MGLFDEQRRDDTRERIVRVAGALFARRGVRGVSVDELRAITGVSAAEFVSIFPTHDDVVLAYLDWWNREWMLELMTTADHRPDALPEDRLLAVFDALAERFGRDDFEVLPFTRVLMEMGRAHPLGEACVRHLAGVRSIMQAIAAEAGFSDPAEFAASWHILLKGAFLSGAEGDAGAATRARTMAHALIERHRTPGDAVCETTWSVDTVDDQGDWVAWL